MKLINAFAQIKAFTLIKILILITGMLVLWGCSNQTRAQVKSSVVNFDKPRTINYFPDYVKALKKYAIAQGIDKTTINQAFNGVHYVEHVVKADKNQPEKKISLDEYLAQTVSAARVSLAKRKYSQFHAQLREATLLTHVPQNYILALWGIESAYGKYQGSEDIISALSTLAFDGRRETFFIKELLSALTILQKGYIKKSQFKGSWAGAMGQNQFMPSSYLAYGLDGDGDGIIDIWSNEADIFASTGNYLATIGWNDKEGWGCKIKLPNDFKTSQAGLSSKKAKPVSDWLKMGIQFIDNKTTPKATMRAWVVIPEMGRGNGNAESSKNNSSEGYLISNNFRTLMNWNRSYYFALSVGMLADSLTESLFDTDQVAQ